MSDKDANQVIAFAAVDVAWCMVDGGWWMGWRSGSHRPSGKNNVVASAFVQPATTAGSSQQLLPTRIFKLFLPCPNTARYSHPLPRSLYSSDIFGLIFSLNSLGEYIFRILINVQIFY